jgi:hypothetical protein
VQIATLAARDRIPSAYSVRDYVVAGGLMSYGTDLVDRFRQTGVYAGKILNGTKPARPSGHAADQDGVRHQSQDSEGARPHHPGNAVGHGRRGDPVDCCDARSCLRWVTSGGLAPTHWRQVDPRQRTLGAARVASGSGQEQPPALRKKSLRRRPAGLALPCLRVPRTAERHAFERIAPLDSGLITGCVGHILLREMRRAQFV